MRPSRLTDAARVRERVTLSYLSRCSIETLAAPVPRKRPPGPATAWDDDCDASCPADPSIEGRTKSLGKYSTKINGQFNRAASSSSPPPPIFGRREEPALARVQILFFEARSRGDAPRTRIGREVWPYQKERIAEENIDKIIRRESEIERERKKREPERKARPESKSTRVADASLSSIFFLLSDFQAFFLRPFLSRPRRFHSQSGTPFDFRPLFHGAPFRRDTDEQSRFRRTQIWAERFRCLLSSDLLTSLAYFLTPVTSCFRPALVVVSKFFPLFFFRA